MRVGSFLNSLVSVVAGFVAGAITVQMVAPDLLKPSAERLPEALTARLVAAGNFEGADPVREASGRAQVLDGGDVKVLRFTDFDVTRGPDLEVWLLRDGDVEATADIRAQDVLSLGRLKRMEGDQVYLLPDGLDPTGFAAVAIWGAQFNTLHALAPLALRDQGS